MAQDQFERLYARILITFENGSEIAYLYNRESLQEIGLEVQKFDKSMFIEVGMIITVHGEKYKVVQVNFKLTQYLNDMSGGYGINMHGMTDPTDFNCQIGVFLVQA